MGSASLFLAVKPTAAILCDTNALLVETFATVRDNPAGVYRALCAMPIGSEAYLTIRNSTDENFSPTQRAARFIYLMRFCYNGVYRTDRHGRFNVPPGTRTGRLPTKDELSQASALLRRALILDMDFEAALDSHARTGDFVYLDPPYHSADPGKSVRYTPSGFLQKDFERLTNVMDLLDSRGAKFVMSYPAIAPASQLELVQKWHHRKIVVRRQVSSKTHARGQMEELFISNFDLGEGDA